MSRRGVPLKVVLLLTVVAFLLGSMALPGSAQEMSRLDKILKDGKITVGLYLANPPWGSRDEAGNPIGYDVDLAKQLAEDLGVELDMVETTNEARVPMLVAGKADAVIATFTRTLERAKSIDFTDPVVMSGAIILARAGSGINGMEDLNGKIVAYEHGSTAEVLVEKYAPEAESLKVTTKQDMLLALRQGKADATIVDAIQAAFLVNQEPDVYELGGPLVASEFISIGLPKGDQNWLNWMNLWVFEMHAFGKNRELYNKWFLSEPIKLTPEW